jgi:hypothetical protein
MVSMPQTPTHGALAKFRTEVTSSMQMFIPDHHLRVGGQEGGAASRHFRSQDSVNATRPIPKGIWGRQQFYWH